MQLFYSLAPVRSRRKSCARTGIDLKLQKVDKQHDHEVDAISEGPPKGYVPAPSSTTENPQ